jgi:hypothetical protein
MIRVGEGDVLPLRGGHTVRLVERIGSRPTMCSKVWRGTQGGSRHSTEPVIVRTYALSEACEAGRARMQAELEALELFGRWFAGITERMRNLEGAPELAFTTAYCDIPSVVHHGEEDGLAYLVLSNVRGHGLEELQYRHVALAARLVVIAQVAQTLASFHDAGRIHGGLHAGSVLLQPTKAADLFRVGLVDFARSSREGGDRRGLHSSNPERATAEATSGHEQRDRFTETASLAQLALDVIGDCLGSPAGSDGGFAPFEVGPMLKRAADSAAYLERDGIHRPADWLATQLIDLAWFLQKIDGADAAHVADQRLLRARELLRRAQRTARAADWDLLWDVLDGMAGAADPHGRIAAARFVVLAEGYADKPPLDVRSIGYLASICAAPDADALRALGGVAAKSLAYTLSNRQEAIAAALVQPDLDGALAVSVTRQHLLRRPLSTDQNPGQADVLEPHDPPPAEQESEPAEADHPTMNREGFELSRADEVSEFNPEPVEPERVIPDAHAGPSLRALAALGLVVLVLLIIAALFMSAR